MKTKRKVGRPKGALPAREKVYQVRLRADERQELEDRAKIAGLTVAAYLRARGLSE